MRSPFGAGLRLCSTWPVPASDGGPRFDPIKRPALFWIDVAVKAALIGLLLFGVLAPDLPQFEGKAWLGRALAYPISALIVPVAWLLVQRRRGRAVDYPYTLDILLVLPFLIDTAGNAANLYNTIDWWDDANHFVNWGLLVAAFCQLLIRLPLGRLAGVAIAIGFGAVTAILWEFGEYFAFIRNSPELATAYTDTLGALALGLTGSVVAAVLTYAIVRPKPVPRST
jgi:hypothetical protein